MIASLLHRRAGQASRGAAARHRGFWIGRKIFEASAIGYDTRMIDQGPMRLSSRLTFIFKFIFPSVWLLGFSAGTLALLTRPNERGIAIPFGVATIIGVLLFSKVCFPLKSVIAGREGILVSNFFRKIEIPYAQIASVDENKWLNTRVTTVWLKSDSAFGQELRFQPYTYFTLLFWRDHPAVVELRRRVELASERRSL
ncbi:MAG TPA: hypothetical protein VII08_10365 [Myxococcales bacterium]